MNPAVDVFVKKGLPKPFHRERAKIRAHEVSCECGTRWLAAPVGPSGFSFGNACPDCSRPPSPGRIGPEVEREVDVDLTFGSRGTALVLDKDDVRAAMKRLR